MSSDTTGPDEREKGIATRASVTQTGWRAWLLPLGLIFTALALQALASRKPHFIEHYYSRTVFPHVGHALSRVNGLFGFSLAELIIIAIVPLLIGALIYQGRQIVLRRRPAGKTIRATLLSALWLAGSAMMLFLLLWGFNYERELLGSSLGLARHQASYEQLEIVGEWIVNGINSNYEASRGGLDTPRLNRAQLNELIESAYQHEPLLAGLCNGGYAQAKPVYFSGLMSRLGLSGIYFPFTGEANFNAAQPDFDLPYVIAHEKAHQCGFAREDEADFIAFLVCSNSSNSYLRYSGYLNALSVVYALAASAPDRYGQVSIRLAEGPRADLSARSAFWSRYAGRASQLSHRINNSYLKANHVASGAQSYREDVALIVAYYLTRVNK
ncbi:MAG: DUF3810 domain-containing protein [Pyrinomonadaceae bacterium]